MSNYNVNLPKTNFPMKADLAKREPNILKYWDEINLYHKINEQNKNKSKFILHDGPPYANGPIHLGHALNNILKDITNKAKLMSGFNVPFIPGWDCHGLPIELNVEKKIGKVGEKVSKEEFITKCREYANSQVALQKKSLIRLGILGDWNNPYITMNYSYEADVVRALAKIISNDYLERGFKPVHWCAVCGSALAEAEVEYKDKTSPAIDVRFRIVDEAFFKKYNYKNISIPIWTTTPWTLPANEAVALNADLEYVIVELENECLIIAKDLLVPTMQRYGIAKYNVKETLLGKELAGIKLQHPFLEKKVPVILGDHVTVESGTGAVHTAPAHGEDDFYVGQKYNLPIENPVDGNGCFLPNTPYFAGEHVFKANDHVIQVLQEHNNLIHHESIQHSYPHCWRHKTPLIFRATPQWFIAIDKKNKNGKSIRELALEQIEIVKWLPPHGKERIKTMVMNRPHWCVSRQRVWLVPMCLFVHKNTGEIHPLTVNLHEIIAQEIAKTGIIFWHNLDAEKFLQANAKDYPADQYAKCMDTLDVWFDSGVSHFCVMKQRDEFGFEKNAIPQADLYLEAHDQYRGWFQSSLLTSVAMYNEASYKTIFCHGHTVDADGRKMSKSLGNVVDPEKIINANGADILRLWIASLYYFNDTAISDEILRGVIDIYRRIRNTLRYLLGNLSDFDAAKDLLDPTKMLALDKWAVSEVLELAKIAGENYAKYKFFDVTENLSYFANVKMSNFYLDIIKDRLYTMKNNSVGRRSAQTAMYYILETLVRIIAPILSFTAEEVWQEMRSQFKILRKESIFLEEWFDAINKDDFKTEIDWELIRNVREAVYRELEKLRIAGKIGSGLDAEVKLYCDNAKIKDQLLFFNNKFANENELRFIFITSKADIFSLKDKPADAILAENIADLWIKVEVSTAPKCARCWHHRADVGIDQNNPEICSRCGKNLSIDTGETRLFA